MKLIKLKKLDNKSDDMSLQLLQEKFVQQLTEIHSANNFLGCLKISGNLLPEQQLAIYQNNNRSALQQTLAQIYPICDKILGRKYFKQIARDYIKKYPSQYYDLNNYGEYFANFLLIECQQHDELNDFPYLSDLAQLEWFYHASYFAAAGDLFDLSTFAQLTEIQQAHCSFQLAPHLKYITSNYPILSIWNINQLDTNKQYTLVATAENCCIFRQKNNLINIVTVETKIYQLLKSIEQGETLNEISQKPYVEKLPELIKLGWISCFKVNEIK